MIELKEVSVVFGQGTPEAKLVLNRLSLSLASGDFVTVVGSNGAGKSTLLGLLAGEVKPTGGALLIDGAQVNAQTEPGRASLVTRVFQDPVAGTCAGLSIEENLAIAARRGRHRGLRFALNGHARKRYAEQLERLGLGLESRLRDPISLLSGGQRQAVSLLMAALTPSRLLLLDEHTAALDPGTADLVLRLTREIISDGSLTTLMVTHSMRQALDFGHRTIMLHAGQVALDVSGAEREQIGVAGLLERFGRVARRGVDEDSMLAQSVIA